MVAALGTLATSSPRASAAPEAARDKRVRLVPPACEVELVDLEQYRAVLRVELIEAGFTLADDRGGAGAEAELRLSLEALPCDASATTVELAVSSGSGQTERRLVPVSDLDAAARPRAVALASAELVVRAGFHDGDGRESAADVPPPRAATPEPPPPDVAGPRPEPRPTRVRTEERPVSAPGDARAPDPPPLAPRLRLGAAFEYRSHPAQHTSLLGGRIGARMRLSRGPFEVGLDAGGAGGSVHDALGVVRVETGTVATGISHVSGTRHVLVALGPLLEAGAVRVVGDPGSRARGSSESAVLLTAELDAGLCIEPAGGLWFTVDALSGWTLLGTRGFADDRQVAGTTGLVAAVRLGVAEGR